MTSRYRTLTARGALFTALLNFAGTGLAQTFEVLYNFNGVSDGAGPKGGLTMGEDGVLYGTTTGGLGPPVENGTVFSLAPPTSGGGAWTLSTLFYLVNYPAYGRIPLGTLAIDSKGILYGTTAAAGAEDSGGTVFSLTPPAAPGGAWTPNLLAETGGPSSPWAGVVIGKDGILYGGTHSGGAYGYGILYSLTPAPMGESWPENILLNFDGTDGNANESSLVFGEAGVLYGTTNFGGGTGCVYGCGTVFSLTPPATTGADWTETVLYEFGEIGDGLSPEGGVVIGKGGRLYGTTKGGGGDCCGTAYSLTPPSSPGGAWTHRVLHRFDKTDGLAPTTLVLGKDGTLYGTTILGGSGLSGVVFAIKP